jgi:MFS transporter, DHA1 family, tetracycline resistance protein
MRRASLAAIFVTVFLDLLGFGLVVPYLPGVARGLGASDLTATLLGAAYSAMQLVFVPFWGQLSDRVGRRRILVGSALGSMVGFVLLSRADTVWALFGARIWTGISTSNLAVAQAYIADVTGPRDRTKGMGLIGAGIGTGFVLGPVIGGLLDDPRHPGVVPALAGAALALLNAALAALFLPESLPPERRGRGRRVSPFDLERYRAALRFEGTAPALALNFVLVLSFAGMEITFRLFTEDAFRMTSHETGLVLGFVGVVLIGVQGGALRPLSRAIGERALVRAGVLLEAAGFAALALSPRGGVATLYAAMGTLALGSGLCNPSLAAFVSKCADRESQGVVMGVLQSSGAFARVCGPALAGLLYGSVAHEAPYVAGALGMLAGGAISLLLRPRGGHEPSPGS